jgi:hypothetical protein
MDRRGFLGSMLAACVAPAIVRADSLMRIAQPSGWTLSAGNIAIPTAPGKLQLFDGAGILMAEIDLAFQGRESAGGYDYDRYSATATKTVGASRAAFICPSGRSVDVNMNTLHLTTGSQIDLRAWAICANG